MEMITLIAAGMKHRKGMYVGLFILTTLIVTSVVAVFGVRKNYREALELAYLIENSGDAIGVFREENYTEELEQKLFEEEPDLIGSVDCYDAVAAQITGDKFDGNSHLLMPLWDGVGIYYEDTANVIYYFEDSLGTEGKTGMDVPAGGEENKSIDTISGKDGDFGSVIYRSEDTGLLYARKPQKGEVYLPYGLRGKIDIEVGDTITFETPLGNRNFVVAAFVQEPMQGSLFMGVKSIFISDEDFEELYESCRPVIDREQMEDVNEEERLEAYHRFANKVVRLSKGIRVNETDAAWIREVNQKTGFTDNSWIVLTKNDSRHYTSLFMDITCDVILGFVVLEFIIFLVVVGHNIRSEIEIDYVNLGILKAEGYTNGKLMLVLGLQYLVTELVGTIAGILVSIPVERGMSRAFFELTAILPDKQTAVLEGCVFGLLIILVSALYIFFCTRRLMRISPVRAISGGKEQIYFSSRWNAPVTKKGLLLSIGFRQLTSTPARYISIILITMLLGFGLITMEMMTGYIESRTALEAMGVGWADVELDLSGLKQEEDIPDYLSVVEKYTTVKRYVDGVNTYLTLNGERVRCQVYAYPEGETAIFEGRAPLYENEVIVTKQVCEGLSIHMGDTVTVRNKEFEAEYMVVGIFQTMSDTGNAFGMSLDGYNRLVSEEGKLSHLSFVGLILEDASQNHVIADEINEKFGNQITAAAIDEEDVYGGSDDYFFLAAYGSKLMMYIISLIFSVVTIALVCSKVFIQERTDIGIYRALGFTAGQVQTQFAMRFFLLAVTGSILGMALSIAGSEALLELIFSLFGIPHVRLDFHMGAFILPTLFLSVCYFIFAYIVSRKVKTVEARELVVE